MEINITTTQLCVILDQNPFTDPHRIGALCRNLRDVSVKYEINTPDRMAMFIAQAAHESQLFNKRSESLNYTPRGLMDTFKYYIDKPTEATIDGRTAGHPASQEVIANKVYADAMRAPRYQLGNVNDGDGWFFRGGGFLQVTGRNAWLDYARFVKMDIKILVELCRTSDQWAMDVAGWLFSEYKSLLPYADKRDIIGVTKRIQGGTLGIGSRERLFNIATGVL